MMDMVATPALSNLQPGVKLLRFSAEWETRFDTATSAQRVRHFIVSAFIALLIYNVFFVSDWFVLPDMHRRGLLIRLGLVTPVELVILFALYRHESWFVRQRPWVAEGLIVVSGLLAAVSLAVIVDMSHSPVRTLAHAGFAPMLVYGNVVQRLRFRSALLLSLLILSIHGGLLLSSGEAPNGVAVPVLLLNLVTAFFSLVSSYEMEYEERQRFVLRESERQLIDTLDQANRELSALSRSDALTGCANRRQAMDYLHAHTPSPAQAMSLILLDVDHFKAYNDHYGHPAGDRCLRTVADALASVVPHDQGLVARWGGEEFMVILPGHQLAQALVVAESIRTAVSGLGMPHAGSPTAAVLTVSLGVAHAAALGQADSWLDTLQEAADQALYEAKASGRNAVRPRITPSH